jgi:hypothetical protein
MYPEYTDVIQEHFMKPNQYIGTSVTLSGREIKHRSNVRVRHGVAIESIESYDDEIKGIQIHNIHWIAMYDLKKGDKLMNQTGHKFTIGKIIPDSEMPLLPDGSRADILIPFEVGKRCTPGTYLEEVLSRLHEKGIDPSQFMNPEMTAAEVYSNAISALGEEHCIETVWNGKPIKVPYGIIRFFRVDNIPSESFKWTVHKPTESKFNPAFGVKVNWTMMLSLLARGADDLVKYISSQSSNNPFIVRRIEHIRRVINGDLRGISETVRLYKFLNKTSINNQLSLHSMYSALTEREAANTVLDMRLTNSNKDTFGVIETFDSDGVDIAILVPPIPNSLYVSPGDSIIVSPVLVEANQVIAMTELYRREATPERLAMLTAARERYSNEIVQLLSETIARLNNPIVGNSVYGVFSGNNDLEPDQIGIPVKVYKALLRKNKCFANSHDKRVLVWRQPVHTHCELVSMKAVPVSSETLEINPHIISLFEGDLDGDCGFIMVPDEEKAYADLYKVTIDQALEHNDGEYYDEPGLYKKIKEHYDIEHNSSSKWRQVYEVMQHPDLIGISSYPGDVRFERTDTLSQLWNTKPTREYIERDSIRAGWEMSRIKSGTSQAGGIALSFILWLIFKKQMYKSDIGLELYRFVAENALKAKTGENHIIPQLYDIFVSSNRGRFLISRQSYERIMHSLISDAGSNPEQYRDMIELFYEFLYQKSRYNDLSEFVKDIHPLAAIIRRYGSAAEIRKIINTPMQILQAAL